MKSVVLAALFSAASLGSAEQMPYITATLTECFDHEAGIPTPDAGAPAPFPSPDSQVYTVHVDSCRACDCDGCTHTQTDTIEYAAFCPTGTIDVPYVVEEVHSGMSSAPDSWDVERSPVSPGFTTIETCTVCGDAPLTETLTYPTNAVLYVPVDTAIADHLGEVGEGESKDTQGAQDELEASGQDVQGEHDTPGADVEGEHDSPDHRDCEEGEKGCPGKGHNDDHGEESNVVVAGAPARFFGDLMIAVVPMLLAL